MWRALIFLPITRHQKKRDQCWYLTKESPRYNRIGRVKKAENLPETSYWTYLPTSCCNAKSILRGQSTNTVVAPVNM